MIELDEIIIPLKEYKHLKGVEVCYYALVASLAVIMIITVIILQFKEY